MNPRYTPAGPVFTLWSALLIRILLKLASRRCTRPMSLIVISGTRAAGQPLAPDRSWHPRNHYQRETAVVRGLIAGKSVGAHQRQERVIEQLHSPQHARHEDGGSSLQREKGLPGVHDESSGGSRQTLSDS